MITLTFNLYKTQMAQDVAILCNQMATQFEDDPKTAKVSAMLKEVDSDETKPIIARSLTEAFGKIKKACQRYLIYGREEDDNNLERIDDSTTTEDKGVRIPEGFKLQLQVPDSFNRGVTESIKSEMHRFSVDYTMFCLLKNIMPDKAKFYSDIAASEIEDIPALLCSRVSFPHRTPSWT